MSGRVIVIRYEQKRRWCRALAVVAGLMVLAVVPADLDGAEVALAWDLPTHYADGTPLDALIGCRVYGGTDPQQYTELVDLTNGTDHCTVEGLDDDQAYYFAVTAYDNETRESVYSKEIMWAGTSDTNAPVALTNRVTDGLLALYEYGDGSGATIAETSGATPALDLTLQNTNNAVWLPGGGLLLSQTSLASGVAASNLVSSCSTSGQFSVEFWLAPNNLEQGAPSSGSRAVIFTLSDSAFARNLTLEQLGPGYVTSVRTTLTGDSGREGVTGSASLGLTHLVITFDAAGTNRLYLNGALADTKDVGGALSNWNSDYHLILANEATGGSDWSGMLALTAVYNRALSQADVDQNFAAGTQAASALAPIIVVQPEAAAVAEPQAVVFDVVAGGTQPLAYQWRRGGVVIEDETETRYTLNPTEFADDGALFDVIISNSYGVVTSEVATLSVTEYVPTPAQIDVGPSNQTVIAGSDATFTVQASGDDPRFYQWRRDGGDITNENQSVYTLHATTTNDSGATFDVVVSNAYGVATSQVAILTVNPYIPTPPTITAQPVGRSVYEPQPATFSVTATGDAPISYQWYQQLTNGTVIVRGTSSEWTIYPTRSVDDGSQITVVLSNIAGVVTSQVALLNVTLDLPDPPTIVTPPADATVMEPASAAFSVVAAGDATLYYQWRRGTNLLVDATNWLYSVTSTDAALDDGATFDVIVSNAIGVVTSAVAVLTVNTPPDPQAPSITTQPADFTIQEPAAANFAVVASGAATLHYQWRRNGLPVTGQNDESYRLESTTAATDDGALFDVVITNSIGAVTSQVATLTVTAPAPPPSGPEISGQPQNYTVTEPTAAGFSLLASGEGALSYQWRRDRVDINGANNTAYMLNATVAADDGAAFDCVVSNPYGAVTSAVAVLSVTPLNLSAPQLASLSDQQALVGELLTIIVTATDADGPVPALSAPTLPAGASFVDNGGGTGTLSWVPGPTDLGSNLVQFAAHDGLFWDTESAVVTVSSFTVTAPLGGKILHAGEQVEVNWSGVWALGSADVELWKGTQFVASLADDLAAPLPAMSVTVTLPGGLASDTTYSIHVIDSDNPLDRNVSPTLHITPFAISWFLRLRGQDYDGDGRADMSLFDYRSGKWYAHSSNGSRPLSGAQWGWPTAADKPLLPVPADYDGDGKADMGLYNTATGKWYVHSSNGTRPINGAQWGWASTADYPLVLVPADYDGDGRADMGLYNTANGKWYVHSSNGTRPINGAQWGWPSSREYPLYPVPADYDGDGKADMALYDSTKGKWYVHSSNGTRPITGAQWGWPSSKDKPLLPVPADYDGDGKADMALYESTTGKWYVHSSNGTRPINGVQWGWASPVDEPLLPVPGDYDGDGRADMALYNTATGKWYVHSSNGTRPINGARWGWALPTPRPLIPVLTY